SDAEAFPAAALPRDVRITKAKRLVQALFHEIDLGTVDQFETPGVHDDLDAALFENHVAVFDAVGVVDDVSEAVAAGLLDSEAQADALATCVQVVADPVRCRFCKRYCHGVRLFLRLSRFRDVPAP